MNIPHGPSKKRLLFVSQQFPYPLTDGGNIRTFQLLRALAPAYDITLLASLPPAVDGKSALAAVKGLCHEVHAVPDAKSKTLAYALQRGLRALALGQPLAISFNYNAKLRQAVEARMASGKWDLFYWNHLDTVQYAPRKSSVKSAVDTHNLLFDYYAKAAAQATSWWRKALLRLEAGRMFRYERKILGGLSEVLVCSAREKNLLEEKGIRIPGKGGKAASVIPNGVDLDFFYPSESGYAANAPAVVFTGAMGYGANSDGALHFIQDILPRLRALVPGIRFVAVGKNPLPELVQAGKDHPDVEVTGAVDDVRPWVWQSRVFAIPLRLGAGTRLKVAEAFAFGIPTVSTTLGAEGFDAQPGVHLLLADTAEDFAQAVAALMRDAETGAAMGQAARALAEASLSWDRIGEDLRRALA